MFPASARSSDPFARQHVTIVLASAFGLFASRAEAQTPLPQMTVEAKARAKKPAPARTKPKPQDVAPGTSAQTNAPSQPVASLKHHQCRQCGRDDRFRAGTGTGSVRWREVSMVADQELVSDGFGPALKGERQ